MDRDKQQKIVLFWLERAQDGTAPGTHLSGTLKRVSEMKSVVLSKLIASRRVVAQESKVQKIWRLVNLSLRAILGRGSGSILIARYHPLILPVSLFWRITGGRIVYLVQGTLEDATTSSYRFLRGNSLYRFVSRVGAKLAHVLVVGSPEIEDYVLDNLLGRNALSAVVPNGVDTIRLRDYRNTERPIPEQYAVFVGALATWQGVDTMVAATESEQWPKNLTLMVIGDGVDRALLEGKKQIVTLGQLPSREAHTWLAHAMFSLCLKKTDHAIAQHGYWPFKLIESAAVGTPAIATNAKGVQRVVKDLRHAEIVSDDPDAVARAAARVYTDASLRDRLSKNALDNVYQYDWSYGTAKLERLIIGKSV